MCGYLCIGFIDFMFAAKSLIDYTCLFSYYYFERNFLKRKINSILRNRICPEFCFLFQYSDYFL